MATVHAANAPVDHGPLAGAPARGPGLIEGVDSLWDDLRGLAQDQKRLAALESRRADESLVPIVAYGILFGVMVIIAWVGAAGAIALWLVDR